MISVSNVTKLMNGIPLYSEASFQINPGEKVGLVGPNGAGKTTFFNLISGIERPDEGQIALAPNMRISYFSQNVGEMSGTTALEEVMGGNARLGELDAQLKGFEAKLCDPDLDPDEMNKVLEEMGEAQTEFEKLGGYELETNAQEILSGLGIGPEKHQTPVEDFSGGWKMRIALAKVLITLPDIILMDEPTNYLDMETILWLEKWLQNFKGSVFMTSHDRVFMNNVAKKIVEVSPHGVFTYSGNYDFYEKEKELRKKQLEANFARQQATLKKEEEFIAKFKARASHAAQVQSRVKKLDKIDRVELEADLEQMSIMLPEIPRGGNDVAILNDVSKKWVNSEGKDHWVFQNLNTVISRQDKLAVVGVNGAGKSTLMKVIADQTEATSGEVKIGPSVNMGYFGQYSFENLNMDNTVFEEVRSRLPNASDGFLRNLLAAFLFKGDEVFKKVRYLSGGEKARVILAGLLSCPHNLLLLDEPTNHLDIGSREVLLDALKRYDGTIMFVSHDRFFLDELATKVLEVDKGNVYLHPGSYKSYLDMKS
ncbi:MAG: glycosyl transferase family 1 [Peredibacter sp.]|nr:glycosyl transferase family 1 [Peredibacter sp.]|tara:strand:- start:6347 stop:7963 length:1617 start_codon:yes stop_codon:yes gene_type:complete